jgi:plastocyanin
MKRITRAVRARTVYPATALFAFSALLASCNREEPTDPNRSTVAPGSVGRFVAAAASPNAAVMRFGLTNVGSGFPPPSGHDRSNHANDTMVPGTVVIDAGGTVTFEIVNPHQVSIYEPGKRPEDVDTSIRAAMPAGCPNPGGNALITDPAGLVASWADPCNQPRLPITYQFDQPGRYLVICAVNPHFQIGMYGWVIVRDR